MGNIGVSIPYTRGQAIEFVLELFLVPLALALIALVLRRAASPLPVRAHLSLLIPVVPALALVFFSTSLVSRVRADPALDVIYIEPGVAIRAFNIAANAGLVTAAAFLPVALVPASTRRSAALQLIAVVTLGLVAGLALRKAALPFPEPFSLIYAHRPMAHR